MDVLFEPDRVERRANTKLFTNLDELARLVEASLN